MRAESRTCPCCHTFDYEVVRNSTYGFIAMCCECGFAREATPHLLMAA